MKFSMIALSALAFGALSACSAGSEDGAENASSGETAAGGQAEAATDGAATSGEYVSCFFNDAATDKKIHYVNDAAPVPAGASEASLVKDFYAKVDAEHDLSGMVGEPVCTLGLTATDTNLRAGYFTKKSEERGLTTVKVTFP